MKKAQSPMVTMLEPDIIRLARHLLPEPPPTVALALREVECPESRECDRVRAAAGAGLHRQPGRVGAAWARLAGGKRGLRVFAVAGNAYTVCEGGATVAESRHIGGACDTLDEHGTGCGNVQEMCGVGVTPDGTDLTHAS